jgi:electron transport complex protein RnfD
MKFKTNTSPFFSSKNNVRSVMLQVLIALIPGTLVMGYFYGWGVFFNVVLSVSFALAFEALALIVRKRPVLPFLGDFSALITGWLLALALPPLVPWWVVFVGIFFAIIVAKHLYGGLGYNPFNPAMVGFAVLIISFPLEMTQWIQADHLTASNTLINQTQHFGFLESLKIIFGLASTPDWDAITMATPLDAVKTGLRAGTDYSSIIINSPYLVHTASNTWLWSGLAFTLGGLWLLYKKIIHWQIPVSLMAVLIIISGLLHLFSSEDYATPLLHVFSGATILAAFFIATDPVSASTTPVGKLLYGAGIGFLIYVIRTWGNYHDAVAFAVLIMNMAVPTIDYYTQPRTFGYRSKSPFKSQKDKP